MPVVLKGYIIVPHEELSEVKAALVAHTELTRQEPGCISFEVRADADDETKFHIHEVFRSLDDFKAHQTRAQSSPWVQASQNVERHYAPLTTE